MKNIFLFLFFLFFLFSLQAQKNNISANIGICFNGSGDTKGLIYTTEYSRYFKSGYFWSTSFGGTIHDGSFPIIYEYPVGRINDGSVNYTIAGFQTAFHMGKNFLKSDTKEFFVKLGPVVRVQSSSYWDRITVLYEPITNIPFPVVVFENTTPRRTIAVGGSSQIGYSFTIGNNLNLGIVGGFQFDIQGDNLSYLTFRFGKRF